MARNVKAWTVNLLWARAAGHCELCRKDVTREYLTGHDIKAAQGAHIKADASGGPRYDVNQSEEERNSVDNLMLLCHVCHKNIDDHPDEFTVDYLMERKTQFESDVANMVETLGPVGADALVMTMPIGKVDFSVPAHDWRRALTDYGLAVTGAAAFDVSPGKECDSFAQAMRYIGKRVNKFYETVHDDPEKRTAVFAIGPQPVLIGLGTLLREDGTTIVFQKSRETSGWAWAYAGETNSFILEEFASNEGRNPEGAVLLVSVSGEINIGTIPLGSSSNIPQYVLRAKRQDQTAIRCIDDWYAFEHAVGAASFSVHEKYPSVSRIHVFPAMPVSACVAFGMAWNTRLIPEIVVYEKQEGMFKRSLLIGGLGGFAD